MAEVENHYDTMDLYRHSLTLRPTVSYVSIIYINLTSGFAFEASVCVCQRCLLYKSRYLIF